MPKRILITGGGGFIGANLARRVLADGHDVHLLLRTGESPWRLQEILPRVHVHAADLVDPKTVQAVVSSVQPAWVFHLAAYGAYAHQIGMPKMVATNLAGCVSLLDACVDAGVEAFVNAGSSSEYGYKNHAPTEDEVLEPNSHYAVTKAAATHYCQLVARTHDLHAVTVRLYAIYGPFEEPTRLIPSLLVRGLRGTLPALVSPRTARDFVYVDDAVDAMLQVAAAAALPRGAVYNICTGVQTRLQELVERACALLHVTAEPRWGTMNARAWDTDVWAGSPAKIAHDLGWRAETDLSTGLQRTVDWLRRHPDWLRMYEAKILPFLPEPAIIPPERSRNP